MNEAEKNDKVTEISKRLGDILAEHGGLESNVPAVGTHEYWTLKNELVRLNGLRTTSFGHTETESPARE